MTATAMAAARVVPAARATTRRWKEVDALRIFTWGMIGPAPTSRLCSTAHREGSLKGSSQGGLSVR